MILHALLALYGGLWLFGDYQAIKKHLTVLGPAGLHVRLGLRADFLIPYDAIESVNAGEPKELIIPIELKRGAFVSTQKLPGYATIALMGKPKLHLKLKTPIEIASLLGRKQSVNCVGLEVDRPNALLSELRKRVAP